MSGTTPVEAEAILDFWFGEIVDGFCVEDRSQLWFGSAPSLDREIQERFGELFEKAAGGNLDHWCDLPRGRLAVILLLDQFSRNINRGTARAFAHDDRALELCLEGLQRGHDGELAAVERSFFYLPLEHSERLEHQDRCVASFQRLIAEMPPSAAERLRVSLDYAVGHRDVIRRFGRFPHRNRVLGRKPTEDERSYLDEGGATYGQVVSDT